MIYVKDGTFYKCRMDMEIRGVESIWIIVIHNHKSILYGLFYRPPNANGQYFTIIEDSISLAIDTGISNIIVTRDRQFNFLNAQARRKSDMFCTQFSLHQPIDQPTHDTEHSSSLIDILLVMLASHCPQVDTKWSYECGILNFARNSYRTLISANQQQKSLRCLPKVTRLHSNTTRRFQEGISKATLRCDFKYDIYTKAIRRSHDAVRRLHGVVL